MMCPAVTRSELNNSDDIIREVGDRPFRRVNRDRPTVSSSATSDCEGKAGFFSKTAAEQRARRGFTTYRCRHCHCWHIGGVTKSK